MRLFARAVALIYAMLQIKLGRDPTSQELLEAVQRRLYGSHILRDELMRVEYEKAMLTKE